MKLVVLILTATFFQLSASTYAQNITLKKKKATLVQVFNEIRQQTGYDFIYSDRMMEKAGLVDLDLKNVDLRDALGQAFANQPFTFDIERKTIIVKAKTEIKKVEMQDRVLSGRITNEKGEPMEGVSVRTKKSRTTTRTGKDGVFSIKISDDADELSFTFLGYQPQLTKAPTKATEILNIQMKLLSNEIDDVIITGTGITRNKESFTGATSTFSGKELKAIGNNNIINSLKSLDPSFMVLDNDLKGSNPNVRPVIELRGKTTVDELTLKDQFGTDPNQPLFILDGFETSLQTIIDLDMNRVASVVILKDAASTALYGSKAANGVVVVETVQPEPGKLKFSYSNDLRFEGPDLTVYNLMNAREKLEFERLSGRYTINEPDQQVDLDSIYNQNLANVARGVDTYWLAEPLRNVISQNNSINASGGDQVFRYAVSFNYKTNPGVMKGSTRDTWGGNVNMIYRKSKVNINNSFSVGGNTATESRYGTFTNFANANPYYEKGLGNPFLDQTRTFSTYITTRGLNIPNPLYNASLPFKDESGDLTITNNLSIQYDFMPKFRLNGGLSISKGSNGRDYFMSPDHTSQASLIPTMRGRYEKTNGERFNYSANALLTYGNVFNKKHSVTLNLRGQFSHNESKSSSLTAQGFPTGSEPVLGFAYGYEENGYPRASTNSFRSVNFTGSSSYAYDMRYLFDASYRLDGSTSFGKNDPWSPFWSTGIGWNIHREGFLKDNKVLNRLKLYSNIGVTGNQAMGMPVATSIYQYLKGYNQVGLGININKLGNADLLPSKTTQLSYGLDYGLLKDLLTGSFNMYDKTTVNQLIDVAYPTSSGVEVTQMNAGKLITKGYEFRLTARAWNDLSRRIMWRVGLTGATTTSKYANFGNTLDKLNAARVSSGSLARFQDGVSPDDLFTARSLGIDPATGREMFIKENGEHTLDYTEANQPKVGNGKPLLEGMLSNQFTYKDFSVSVMIRYRAKADVFNSALLSKVENISYTNIVNNQDKRALYDRWKKPGDIAQFKSISMTDVTQMSSRFLQEESFLSLESVNVNYTFRTQEWMKSIGLESLMLSAYTNDIFRLSTVKRERGIQYPFARSASFSLRASF